MMPRRSHAEIEVLDSQLLANSAIREMINKEIFSDPRGIGD